MYKIVIDQNPKECDKKIIIDGLIENSKKILGSDDFKEKSFSVFLNDENNIILGGISARYDLESIYIDLLWVADNLRYLGYGSQLLNAAEVEAQKFGCRYSTVDTYSFEAEDFYLKNGYERFGEVKNYWLHHSRIFLRKTLEKGSS